MLLKSLFAALALATASLSWAAGLLEKEVYFSEADIQAQIDNLEVSADQERRLRSPASQDQLADALASGIQKYFAANPPLARHRAV